MRVETPYIRLREIIRLQPPSTFVKRAPAFVPTAQDIADADIMFTDSEDTTEVIF